MPEQCLEPHFFGLRDFTLKCDGMKSLILKEYPERIKDIFTRGRKPVTKSKKGKMIAIFIINLQSVNKN